MARKQCRYLLLQCLLVVLVTTKAASRQLEPEVEVQQHNRRQTADKAASNQQLRLSYTQALANSSCHGFLIGIGTQKGGTTALWAYIKDKAHPHLRVSESKELGFWDSLHTKFSGCRVGDYLQLQTKDEPGSTAAFLEPPHQILAHNSKQQLPICEAISSFWLLPQPEEQLLQERTKTWTSSSMARLQPSKDCGQLQTLLQSAGDVASSRARPSAQELSTPPSGLVLPVATTPGTGSQASLIDSAQLLLQQLATETSSEALDGLTSLTGSTPGAATAATAASNNILGATALLNLPQLKVPQPMYHADITPRYLFDPAVPPRVRSLLPEARIIVIFRDPVARAVSNFNMWWQKHAPKGAPKASWSDMLAAQVDGEITRLSVCYAAVGYGPITQPDLAECLGLSHPYSETYDMDLFVNRLLAQGMYADELQRWFELFPAESFLIWVSEDFKSDPATHMQHLVAWLGLDPELLDPKLRNASAKLKPVHSRNYDGSPKAEVVARMRHFFEPHNKRLFNMLDAKGFGAVAARMRQVWPQ